MANMSRSEIKAPTEEYFYNRVLGLSSGIEDPQGIRWELALCLLLAWALVFLVLIKGISSLGKVVYFSSIFPYVLLTVMLVRGVTLEGALNGILFYIKPDFSRLADATVWSDAAVQIFFSLSVCTGGMVAMASYNKFDNNCLRDSILVPLVNCGTSFFAGFVIFSVLGYMAHTKGVDVADVAASGPGLVFVVYPEGLTTMPLSPLWAVLFFFMMTLLGFSSEFSIMECFFSSMTDEFAPFLMKSKKRNILFRFIFCCIFFVITLSMVTRGGFYLVTLFDEYIGGFPLLVVGLTEVTFIQYIYGQKKFAEDVKLMLGKEPNFFFKYTWLLISPLLLAAITVFKAIQYRPLTLGTYSYPSWSMGFAWILVALPTVFIPGWALGAYCRISGWKALKKASTDLPSWGPSDKKAWHKSDRYAAKAGIYQNNHTSKMQGVDNTAYEPTEDSKYYKPSDKPVFLVPNGKPMDSMDFTRF